jgi:hypothetical protein
MPIKRGSKSDQVIHTDTGVDDDIPGKPRSAIRNPDLAEDAETIAVQATDMPVDFGDATNNAASNGYWIHDTYGPRWYVPDTADNDDGPDDPAEAI